MGKKLHKLLLSGAAVRGIVGGVKAEAKPAAAVDEVSDLMKAFEAFKETHSEKIKAEAKGAVDALTVDKIEKINARLDAGQAAFEDQQAASKAAADELLERVTNIMNNGGSVGLTEEQKVAAEHMEAQLAYMRNGQEMQLKDVIPKVYSAAVIETPSDGGYLAPVEWDRSITKSLLEVVPMRRFAGKQNVTKTGFSRLYNMRGTTSGWVGETDARPETDTPTLKSYAFAFGEVYANPSATLTFLDDAEIDGEAWLHEEVAEEMALQEGQAFLDGDGVNKPKGILMYDAAAEGALAEALKHPLGPVLETNTGAASDLTAQGLIDLVSDMPEQRAAGASFAMNRKTTYLVRSMLDGDGRYIWQPMFKDGIPATVLGHPQRTMIGMPDVAAGTIPVLFGDIARAYRIFDRVGTRMLRDPYTKKPYIMFYTTRRVGGGLWNPEWLRYHRVAA